MTTSSISRRNFTLLVATTPALVLGKAAGSDAARINIDTARTIGQIDRKLYGNFGYIDFVPSPDPEVVPGKPQVDLTIDVDEGHQFFVRRIDFQGNTTTRDKVIRREILIDEGHPEERGAHDHGGHDRRRPGRPERIPGWNPVRAGLVG